mgnify:CR=1 FL=1
MKKRFNNKLYKKAKVVKNNDLQLRVLYKKVGQAPQIKIIKDIENFKKSIILDKLDIIPYKHVFIICNNQEHKMKMPINVFFSLYHIAGDLVVVDIDKDKREFKSLTQDQLQYYSKDLIGREPNKVQDNNNCNVKSKTAKNGNYTPYERDIETDNTQLEQTNFAKSIIHILVNIELMLANLLKNKMNGDIEDE